MYVEMKNIYKQYGDFRASDNVSFGIEKGRLVALLGPSGSGKTTLLRMIAGLETPNAGDIYIDGRRVNDIPASKRGIGFVFQSYALFRYMTVYDNVAFGLELQKVPKAEIKRRVTELLEITGLSGMEKRYPNQLSGGQRQRVAFARALAPNPQVLLLDEPFAAIDAKVRSELRLWLRSMVTKLGITSIFVTHDQDEAVEVADVSRGCVLAAGNKLPISKSFTATILWMDDKELTPGTDYIVKLGTKQMPAILKNIQYKIDVNTGAYIPANSLKKNEIAVCDISLQEEIVLDEFKKHKTLGELILIDRITNMTSACGVVEKPSVDDSRDLKTAFVYGSLKANGDIFEEFYYNLDSMTINKIRPSGRTYTVGDEIPVNGESYSYPDSFDVVVLRDKVAVRVRDRKVESIGELADYKYSGVPVINGRGFAVKVNDEASYAAFAEELAQQKDSISSGFFNKWLTFETYRKIVFKDEIWN